MNRCLPAYSLGVLLQWAYQLAPFLPDFVALNFPFAPSYGSRVPSIPLRWPLKHKLPVPERIFALLAERPLRILLRPVPYELHYVAGTLRRIPKRRNPELLAKRPGFCGISPSKLNCPPGKRLRWRYSVRMRWVVKRCVTFPRHLPGCALVSSQTLLCFCDYFGFPIRLFCIHGYAFYL